MAINFPDSPTNAQEITEGNVTYVYNATKGYWESSEVSSGGASTDVLADMAALIAKTGMSNGDQAFVTGNNNLYIYSGSGWYKVATVQNDAPSAITGVNGTYELAIDGTATTITAVSTDPEGFPLTWSYSTSGLGSIATVSHSDGVFTITPSTTEADAGTFTLTINATDGVNGAVSTSASLTLEFIIIVTNSRYTTLLATATGTSDNNNITDSSSNNRNITVNGDAHAGTFSPYRPGGYSTKFEPNSYFNILNQPAIGSGDCSIECWVNVSTLSQWHGIIKRGGNNQAGNFQFYVRNDTEIYLNWSGSSAGTAITTSGANIQPNTWYWLQVIRSSGTVNIYVNGVSKASFSDSSNISSTTYYDIGGWTSYYSDALIRDLRVSTVARSSSTGPSDKLEVDSDTTFLTCNLPYVTFSTPSAVNNYVQYISGPVSTKPFSPYDYEEYSAADYSGSVYFDGSGDKLTIGGSVSDFNFGTNSFTIECWAYHQAAAVGPLFNTHRAGTGDGYYIALLSNGGVNWGNYVDGTGDISTSANVITQSTWNHISVNRDSSSSNSLKIYVNGILRYTGTSATDYNTFNYGPFVGGYDAGGVQYDFTGYLSDIIVVNGSVLRTGGTSVGDVAFTPPSTPIATPSNTKLHIKGTDASIIDKAQGTNLKLVGNTTGSTTQVKFIGSKSMYFDGSGDYIQASLTEDNLPNEFTIEGWVYTSTVSGPKGIFGIDTTAFPSTDAGIAVFTRSSTYNHNYAFYCNGNQVNSTTPPTANTWQHFALVRNSSNLVSLYLDGSSIASSTISGTVNGSIITIGGYYSSSYLWNGYIQDFRITKGLARYTANFTPPTASLEG
jgi:hypothetical protein